VRNMISAFSKDVGFPLARLVEPSAGFSKFRRISDRRVFFFLAGWFCQEVPFSALRFFSPFCACESSSPSPSTRPAYVDVSERLQLVARAAAGMVSFPFFLIGSQNDLLQFTVTFCFAFFNDVRSLVVINFSRAGFSMGDTN